MPRALLIDPFVQRITSIEVVSPAEVKHILGSLDDVQVTQLTPTDHLVLARVSIEQPGMRFWSLPDSPLPIAGRALIRGNTIDGMQVTDVNIDLILLQQSVGFPEIRFAGWETVPRFEPLEGPQVVPQLVNPPPAPQVEHKTAAQGTPWSLWTITEGENGYSAALVTVDGDGHAKSTGVVLENEDLDELRSFLPRGLVKTDRTKTDDPSIVETWHTATN